VSQNGINGKAKFNSTHPLLSAAFLSNTDPTKAVIGGCDGQVKCWNIATNQPSIIGMHNSAVKELFYSSEINCVISGSWDKSLKYWDLRSSSSVPAANVNLNDRVYCMDVKGPVLVCGTADKKLFIFDVRKPQIPYRNPFDSPLKYQSRCLAIFPDHKGFAVGSIEGRVGIQHIEEKDKEKNFAFKCHRIENEVYAVNSITFHPIQGTFATSGSDGTYVYWDKDSKQRLKLFNKQIENKLQNSITAATFNAQGNIFAYAIGYDWSKGIEFYDRQRQPNSILLHAVKDDEIKRKPSEQGKK